MGEYATYLGQSVKIGTCESMYYLRADQAHLVTALSGNVDPIGDRNEIRFRFPFPDEDAIAPGGFEDYNRRLRLNGVRAPAELADDHSSVQFTSPLGYVASLPCPESIADAPPGLGAVKVADGVNVHRNGFGGATFLSQQRLVDGELLPILECACGMAWRVPTIEECAPIFAALASEHERYLRSYVHEHERPEHSLYSRTAERIRQGFDREHVASLGFVAVASL